MIARGLLGLVLVFDRATRHALAVMLLKQIGVLPGDMQAQVEEPGELLGIGDSLFESHEGLCSTECRDVPIAATGGVACQPRDLLAAKAMLIKTYDELLVRERWPGVLK